MLSAARIIAARSVRAPASAAFRSHLSTITRQLSSSTSAESNNSFHTGPPSKLTADMAEGIADVTHFYIRHGLAQRRLQTLAQQQPNLSVLEQWQAMIEIFLATQVHVIAGMGYDTDEKGLTQYARDLATLLQETDDAVREAITDTRRDTWRELVATCYNFNVDDIPTLTIAQARELMHTVSAKMVEPDMLLVIQSQTAKISDPDPEMELAKKHQVLQDVIVNHVYLGEPSVTEQFGFGKGPQAYAKLQCAMSDHEGDPLIGQYASSAMMKIFSAAGLDLSSIQGPGLS